MTDNRMTELLHVGDILWNEPCDERIVVIAASEQNVWLRKVQKNDELAMHDGRVWAMLGKKSNVKNMCTQSYAQSVFELDGHVEHTIVATLGSSKQSTDAIAELRETVRDAFSGESVSMLVEGNEIMQAIDKVETATLCGTLTAEQVREAIEKRFDFDVWVPKERWQAIADELNAELGGTCECVWNEQEGTFRCSSCDTLLTNEISIEWPSHKVTPITLPNYCRNCGRAVKR